MCSVTVATDASIKLRTSAKIIAERFVIGGKAEQMDVRGARRYA